MRPSEFRVPDRASAVWDHRTTAGHVLAPNAWAARPFYPVTPTSRLPTIGGRPLSTPTVCRAHSEDP